MNCQPCPNCQHPESNIFTIGHHRVEYRECRACHQLFIPTGHYQALADKLAEHILGGTKIHPAHVKQPEPFRFSDQEWESFQQEVRLTR